MVKNEMKLKKIGDDRLNEWTLEKTKIQTVPFTGTSFNGGQGGVT